MGARSCSRRRPPPRRARPAPSPSRPRAAPTPSRSRSGSSARRRSPPCVRCAIEGLIAGTSRTVNLAQYLDSPLTAPQCSVAGGHRCVSGTGVSASASGCQLTVTASDKARGDARIAVQVIDAPGRPRGAGRGHASVSGASPTRQLHRSRWPTGSSAAARASTSDRRPTTVVCRSRATRSRRSDPAAAPRPARRRRAPSPA